MDERRSTTLEPGASSPGLARRFVRATLTPPGVESDVIETVELLATELVTNAVLHARSDVVLTIRLRPDRVRVEVVDGSPRHPVRQLISATGAAGRGLTIVEALSATWGVDDLDTGGKLVWFEVAC